MRNSGDQSIEIWRTAIGRTVAAQKGQLSSRSTHSKPVLASIFVFFLFGFVTDDDDVPVEEEAEP